MVVIYYNVNRAQTVSYTQQLLTIHDTSHFSWETLPCVMVPTHYIRRNEKVLALDLEGVHDVKLHHPSSSVATSNQ